MIKKMEDRSIEILNGRSARAHDCSVFTNFSGNDDIKKNPESMSYLITYNDFARASSFLLTFSTLLFPCFHFL
jgi:hypothetical protein